MIIGTSAPVRSWRSSLGIRTINVVTSAVAAYSDGDSNTSSLIALGSHLLPVAEDAWQRQHQHPSGHAWHARWLCPRELGVLHRGAPDTPCPTAADQSAFDLAGNGTLTAPGMFVVGTCKRSWQPEQSARRGCAPIGDPLSSSSRPDLGLPGRSLQRDVSAADAGVDWLCLQRRGGHAYRSGRVLRRLGHQEERGGPGARPGRVHHRRRWDQAGNLRVDHLGPGWCRAPGAGPDLQHRQSSDACGTGGHRLQCAGDPQAARHRDRAHIEGSRLERRQREQSEASIDLEGQSSVDVSGTIYSPKGFMKMEGGSGAGSGAAVPDHRVAGRHRRRRGP